MIYQQNGVRYVLGFGLGLSESFGLERVGEGVFDWTTGVGRVREGRVRDLGVVWFVCGVLGGWMYLDIETLVGRYGGLREGGRPR